VLVRSGENNRASVRGCSDRCVHGTEVARGRYKSARCEVEVLKSGLTSGRVDVVRRPASSFTNLDILSLC